MTDEELAELAAKESATLHDRTKPCLEEFFTRLVGANFQVPSNLKGMVDAKIVPFGGVGENKMGLDVVFRDGSHIEFTIQRTGWGTPLGMDVPKDWFDKVGKI